MTSGLNAFAALRLTSVAPRTFAFAQLHIAVSNLFATSCTLLLKRDVQLVAGIALRSNQLLCSYEGCLQDQHGCNEGPGKHS